MKRDDRLLLTVSATAVTPMITTATAALFAYADSENIMRWGAAGLGIGLPLMFLVGIATWLFSE